LQQTPLEICAILVVEGYYNRYCWLIAIDAARSVVIAIFRYAGIGKHIVVDLYAEQYNDDQG
jgi:hypothetical protein